MQKFPYLKNVYHLIATLGGIGLMPFAPGTFGSIFAWIIFVFISHFLSTLSMLILTIISIFFAIWICEKISRNLIEKDHKAIVIDELAGMWVALIPVVYFGSDQNERTIYAVSALILFRIFDIFKPYPISYFDQKFKNGFGIVFDDFIAGIFAGFLSTLIVIFLI
tara:strand:- start:3318 stop:3812 length:495 start_codon:yes stop_codon:yes gene_type:complete